MQDTETSHPVDVHVGARVRLARRARAMSQETLAQHGGISFQQVQKYENGTNRVSASMLWMLAAALRQPISYFYEGLQGMAEDENPAERRRREFVNLPAVHELISVAMDTDLVVLASVTETLRMVRDSRG